MNNNYDFYIFDCDGVILDSNSIKNHAFRDALKGEDEELINEFIEYHKKNGGVSRYEKFNYFFKNMKKLKQPENDIKMTLEKFSKIVEKKLIDSKYVPGFNNFLMKIVNDNKKLYVVSGGDQEELKKVFSKKNIYKYFEEVLGSPTSKEKNTEFVKNLNSNKGIFFGDSKLDFLCAKKFNLDFVFVKRFSEWEDFSIYESNFKGSINDFNEIV